MKSLFLRSGVALACALSLAACGGSGGSLALSGSILNYTGTGLVLTNNGGSDYAVSSGVTTFVFPTLLGNDTDYNVQVKTQPSNAVCTPFTNTGRTSTYDITSVVINCVINTYALGGTATGLKTSGLVLVNGADKITVAPNIDAQGNVLPATFQFAKVADSAPYGVTVLTQPTGQACTVAGGTGVMGQAAINTIQVTCI